MPRLTGRPPPSAYDAGLRALAQRDLSCAQLSGRLRRRGYPEEEIEAAVARLRGDGSLNDARTAEAAARHLVTIKRRGPARVVRELQARGIEPGVAHDAVRAVFTTVDEAALIDQVLAGQARPSRGARQDRARLYRRLLARGFSQAAIRAALRERFGGAPDDDWA